MQDSGASPSRIPRKNAQALPPTYLAHLSALLTQFLSQQVHKPDPTSLATQREDRPLWDANAVSKLHQAIWAGAMLSAASPGQGDEEGSMGLLGCDWETWLQGAVNRRKAGKHRREGILPPDLTVQDMGERGRRVDEGSVSASKDTTRESSIVSKQRDRASSIHDPDGRCPQTERNKLDLEDYCDTLRQLPGFVAMEEQNGWDLVADSSPARTPIRDFPGAFPQMSSAWSPQASLSRSSPRRHGPQSVPAALPDQLLIVLCVQFAPAIPAMTTQSSASTMRTARESSAEPTSGSILSPPPLHQSLSGLFSSTSSRAQGHGSESGTSGFGERQGSGGRSSGLNLNWWPSRWSEGAKGATVEAEFVPGRFALPKTSRRVAVGDIGGIEVIDTEEGEAGDSDSDTGSNWSGTQRAPTRNSPENVLLSAVEPGMAVGDEVGLVGGTFVIRGMQDEQEREALIRVLKGVIYALQCQLLELALMGAFRVPREPDAPQKTLRRANSHRDTATTSPKIDAAIPIGTGKKHSNFFSKLGLESRGRNVLDGLMGRKKSIRPRLDISQNTTGDAPGRHSLDAHRKLSRASSAGSPAPDPGMPTIPAYQTRPNPQLHSQTPTTALSRTDSPSHPSATLHGIDRHLATLKRLENMLHSTTPGLTFPLPRILLRVRDEDKIRREKALEEVKAEKGMSGIEGLPRDLAEDAKKLEEAIRGRAAGYRLGGDVRVGLGALASVIEGWEGWCRLQRLDVLTWDAVVDAMPDREELVDKGVDQIDEKGGSLLGTQPDPTPTAEQQHPNISLELQSEGAAKEKALPKPPSSTSNRTAPTYTACTRPTQAIHRYHDPSSDFSIAEYLSELTEELGGTSPRRTPPSTSPRRGSSPTKHQPNFASGSPSVSGRASPTKKAPSRRMSSSTMSMEGSSMNADLEASTWENVCARKGCDASAKEHVRIWVQGSRRVTATFGPGEEGCEGLKVGVSHKDMPEKRVEGALKGIAAIIYTTLLVPPHLRTLAGPEASPTNFTYSLKSSSLSVSLCVDDVPVLDARLPKLQVGPNVVKRRLGAGGAQAAFDGVLRKGWAETAQENVRAETGGWMGGMRLRVHHLRREMTDRNISQDAKDAALNSLQGILEDIDSTEKLLLDELYSASAAQLNDTRLWFCDEQVRLQKTLDEWMAGNKAEIPKDFAAPCPVPKYAQGKEMCIPGGFVLVRLDEPGSVIAYTLSSKAYFSELCSTRGGRTGACDSASPDDGMSNGQTGKGTTAQSTGGWTIEIKRKETPRDLLSLRTVTKKRSEASLPLRAPLSVTPNQPSLELNLEPVTGSGVNQSERMDEIVKTISKATAQNPILTTGSTSGSGAASIRSLAFEDGRISPSKRSVSSSLAASFTESEGDKSDPGSSTTPTLSTSASAKPFAPTPLKIRRRLTDDVPPSAFRRTVSASVAPMTPRSDFSALGTPPRSITPSEKDKEDKENVPQSGTSRRTLVGEPQSSQVGKDKEGWGSVTSTLTSNIAHLLRFGTDVSDSLASRVRAPVAGSADSPSGLLHAGAGTETPNSARPRSLASAFINPLSQFSSIRGISADRPNTPANQRDGADGGLSNALSLFYNRDAEDKPHIQFSFTLPGKTRISCTVYYAAAFDTLRRRCAVDRSFVKSLESTIGWAAEGGKSKANFWKSVDGRLVVKELISKWNVSDMQALLEVAPAYFEHMANTHNRATSLAKIVGFFSVKVHDIQSGQKRTMDLLVMENLWWQQTIGKQYDLKGMEGRRVPKGREDSSTHFDAEWLDAQAKSPILVHPAAKRILLESLAFDTRFLSQQSIMDYSLLLGLDTDKPEMVVGLVDAVGSYGLFKNIESRGKMAFNRGREGEVTVIPPDQYRERFETALKQYFTVAPDKWSRAVRRPGVEGLVPRAVGACGQSDLPAVF